MMHCKNAIMEIKLELKVLLDFVSFRPVSIETDRILIKSSDFILAFDMSANLYHLLELKNDK